MVVSQFFSLILLFPRLFYDMMFSWSRMIFALIVSILFSWAIGITAGRNQNGERVIIPVLDILQSIPILGFFPIVLVVFVSTIHGQLGVDLAVTFLIFTSMAWNITFSVYEATKAIPKQYLDLAALERMSFLKRLTSIYIPCTWTKVAFNSIISWAVALFYLVSSEIFTLGNSQDQVRNGIGVDLANFAGSGSWGGYAEAVFTLIIVDILTWVLILEPFSRWSEKYKVSQDPVEIRKNLVYRFYSRLNGIFITRLSYALARGGKVYHFLSLPSNKFIATFRVVFQKSRFSCSPSRIISQTLSGEKILPIFLLPVFVLILLPPPFHTAVLRDWQTLQSAMTSFQQLTTKIVPDEAQVGVALGYSFVRVWISYAIATSIALPFGIYVALNERVYAVMTPVLQVVASIPAPVLLPPIALVIATMPGGGEIDALIVIVIAMGWYLVFNIMEGVRTLPKELRSVSALLDLKGGKAWRHVYIPAALPSLITGSITAVGGAWNALIVAEYFSIGFSGNGTQAVITQVPDGIGKLLDIATEKGDITLLFLSLVSMVALIVSFNFLVWKRLYNYSTKRYAQFEDR
jgi:NitT/TauT family transport system permease protein